MSIFKDCDIRGVYGPELNADMAYRLGRATGMRLAGRDTVVGGDLRVSTPILKAALSEGLVQSGVRVIDVGILPTPALYFAKQHLGAYGGIMVTASHNAARYNGFKLILGDLPITPEELQEIAQAMQVGDSAQGQGTCRSQEVLSDYEAFLVQAFPGLRPYDLVVDAGNGSLSEVAPAVLRHLGQHVDALYCVPDGTFPYRDPNPAVPSHLADLCQRVRATGTELGVAYDGDGDRVIFVDGRGQVLPADRTLVLLLRYLLQGQPGAGIVYDLKSSSVVADETLAAGGRPLMERSGHAFIKRRLLQEKAVLGGEISGHYFFGALGGDDALYATLMLLRVLDELELTLSEAMDTVPAYPNTPDLRLPCPTDRARCILDELDAAFQDHPLDRLDGVRVRFAHGWALARISVTEPLLTLRFEARTEKELAAIQAEVRRRAPQIDALLAESGLLSRKD